MPLLRYFTVVGAALLVVLLVINAVIEPARPPLPPSGQPRAVTVAKPRVTTGSAAEIRPLPARQAASSADTTGAAPEVQAPQLSPPPTPPPPATAPPTRKKKRAATRPGKPDAAGAGRAYGPSRAASDPQDRAARSYAADGTLGPH
jgi:hypothetical protein